MRYARQTILPEIGEAGQKKISAARVLVVGAGGLGCPVLLYLAGAGVGHIGIVDFDVVEETNLHRQILFTMDNISKKKADVAAEKLRALNPHIAVQSFTHKLDSNNAHALIQNYDIIIDGTDNFTAKFLINDVCVSLGKPFIYGAVLGFEGQVAVFNDVTHAPNLRTLFPHPPHNHIPNCAENGVLGAVAGMIGTMQAIECLKLIVNTPALPYTKNAFIKIDTRTMRTHVLTLKEGFQMPAQDALNKEESFMIKQISVQDTRKALEKNPSTILVDVREKDEWNAGHIEGAEFFPLSDFVENGATPPWNKDDSLIMYCRSGKRSDYVANALFARGYKDIANMVGGFLAWE